MLRGERVGLRPRLESDIPIFYTELYSDVEHELISNDRPWVPRPPGQPESPFALREPKDDMTIFTAIELASDEVVGSGLLWGIDLHNRIAHIGISLRPAWRGRGFGVDVVRTLCHYGFVVRGLHRIQIETLASNEAMLRTAERVGFGREGVLRESAYLLGRRVDEVILGLLAADYATEQGYPAE